MQANFELSVNILYDYLVLEELQRMPTIFSLTKNFVCVPEYQSWFLIYFK